jgi:glucan endo-1,3-alpha-glucosidase
LVKLPTRVLTLDVLVAMSIEKYAQTLRTFAGKNKSLLVVATLVLLAAVVIFAVSAQRTLYRSQAAGGANTRVEAETGTVSSSATTFPGANASGGRAVRFGAPTARNHTRLVFAHYMLCCPTYGGSLAAIKRDIQEAQANGIDGWALNTSRWASVDPTFKTRAATILQAAQELGTHFKIFFSADMVSYLVQDSGASIRDMITSFANHPNYFKYQNRPFLSTWNGEDRGRDWWVDNVLTPLRNAGYNVYFIPKFDSDNDWSYTSIVNAYSGWWKDVVDGMYFFGAAGTPTYIGTRPLLSGIDAWGKVMHDLGKTYMSTASPQYWESDQTSNGRRYMEYQGGEGLAAEWNSIIAVAKPEWVEVATWNDFAEFHYFSPAHAPAAQNANGLALTHRGAAAMQRYYIQWYKTGVQPAITRDDVFYFYRTHRKDAVASNDPLGPVTTRFGDVQDDIYVSTMLTAPAELRVITGGVTKSHQVGAGIVHTRVPFNTGTQVFELWRDGIRLWRQQGASIDASIAVYNFGYYTGSTLTTPP